jgi:hypothetical protein
MSVKFSADTDTDLRIDFVASAPVTGAKIIASYPDSLILDFPGAVYRAIPHRTAINHAGVRTIRVWMQSEDPPLTRVVIEIDRAEQYLLSTDGNAVVLRLGPALQEVPTTITPDSAERRRTAPAGQATASASAAGALARVFRHGPGKPMVYGGSKIRNGQPIPQEYPVPVPVPAPAPAQIPKLEISKDSSATSSTVPAEVVQPVINTPSINAESGSAEKSSSADVVSAEPVTTVTSTPAEVSPEQVGSIGSTTPDLKAIAIANPGMRTEFKVKYVEYDAAYLDGGRSSGLAEGMKLVVRDPKAALSTDANAAATSVAELVVVAVAETSAVTEIHIPKREVVPGDFAYLSSQDVEALVQKHAVSATRKYPAVISFSEGGDALDEEARAFVPRPPLPSVNRATGRIGLDYTGTKSNDASQAYYSALGVVLRADFTRIGGTYWNLRGYWRGRLTSASSASRQTLQDLINRTYHLGLTYENPDSRWVIGVGRLYLPWATSLDTLDGGYFGGRLRHGITAGMFGGSTPDPTSWNYSPNRHIGGGFINAEGGSFDAIHYSSTAGVGRSFESVQYSTTSTGPAPATYQDNRTFAFLENSVSYKRTVSVFHALQADQPSANPAAVSPGTGISRSFLTVRVQPVSRVELSANHTYFRDIPTFDPQLVGTGLLDKYLFQGLSGGVRVEVVKNIALYTDLGRSSRTGDAKTSLNQMYGITFMRIPRVEVRADAHYSRFTSSFGSGTYRAFSFSRNFGEALHLEVLGGDQMFTSSLAGNQDAKFFTTTVDSSLGALFFVQGGFTVYRGQLQNYNQWFFTLGYRFDNKWKHK